MRSTASSTPPPGPRARFPFSTVYEFRRDPLGYLTWLARAYGDVVRFVDWPVDIVLINDPDLIREVLITQQHVMVQGPSIRWLQLIVGNGMLAVEGDAHRRQRRLAQPAFHRQRVAAYADQMTAMTETHLARWQDGHVVAMADAMSALTRDIVAQALFGTVVDADAVRLNEALRFVNEYVSHRSSQPFADWLHRLPLPDNRRFARDQAAIDAIVLKIADERRKSGEDKGDLLSMLLTAVDEHGALDQKTLRDELVTFFIAGHETTANALTWAFILLAQHPEVEARLHAEVDHALGGRRPTLADVPRLPYVEQVLSETLRLYPPVWAMSRMPTADIELGGYPVRKGSDIVFSQWVTHRDPRFWPDPERFDPDRWTPTARESRPRFVYFPFGGGQRQCIGESFFWLEATMVLATVAQRWR
ncbi:MAG: cytochrome P450, partial [Dehalococcoidia bacterium]|nr:cytochrome P450 [Dehalococcoidia bacterium]